MGEGGGWHRVGSGGGTGNRKVRQVDVPNYSEKHIWVSEAFHSYLKCVSTVFVKIWCVRKE